MCAVRTRSLREAACTCVGINVHPTLELKLSCGLRLALRPGMAGSSPVVRLVLLALKTKAGLRLRRTSLATVLAPPKSAKSGKGMGGATGGAGGAASRNRAA